MRKIIALGLLFLLLVATLILYFRPGSDNGDINNQTENKAGEIISIEGDVSVNSNQAQPGIEIKDGQDVSTGTNSSATIKFGEYRVLIINPESRVVLNSRDKTITLERGSAGIIQHIPDPVPSIKPDLFLPWSIITPFFQTLPSSENSGTSGFYMEINSPQTITINPCQGYLYIQELRDPFAKVTIPPVQTVQALKTTSGIDYTQSPLTGKHKEECETLLLQITNRE